MELNNLSFVEQRPACADGARVRAALCFGLVAALLLALFVGSVPDAAAQTSRTITMSIDGAGPPPVSPTPP